jgi:hypothetical protein
LNSLWGKFAQRNDQYLNEIFTDREISQYFELIHSTEFDISQVVPVQKNMVRVVYKKKKALTKENKNSNVIVAVYTTALARLRLLSYLYKAQEEGAIVLYCDTDSAMLKHLIANCPIEAGDFLGEMMREYADQKITKFRAAGSK